jgi:chromosome segregation ATPase
MDDMDIGIDLGISEYLKGGPTFQIDHSSAPIASQPILRSGATSTQRGEAPQNPAPSMGGMWNPPRQPQASEAVKSSAPVSKPSQATPAQTATIFAPTATPVTSGVAQTRDSASPQHVSAKPTQSNADLDAEKQRLIGERAQIAGAKSAIEAALRGLVVDRQQAENQIKPILARETDLAREIDELEHKEQGLSGEVRRTVERDRWTKTEERRKVEQERLLIKKRLASAEGEVHAKEEEQVSLIKREKDIDARITWIDLEYKRREIRMKLAEANQKKSAVEAHRTILDNGLKRLKASLEETEKNERRLMEEKRALAIKLPQTVAEEERFSQERFDIEKQMHDIEVRRWGLEDELKTAQEMFSKEDMTYLDAMHQAEALQGDLKALG